MTKRTTWTARALALRAIPAIVLGLAACSSSKPPPVSVLLITVDTTTAASLDCYGRDRGITPNLAQLARDGVVFENARTVTPLTLPAHTSMMTGLYPIRHSVRDNGLHALPDAAVTLAERLSEEGYQTAAFVAAVVLAKQFGLDQGFDVYDAPVGAEDSRGDRSGPEITGAALSWLARRDKTRPFLLWAHYFDPHAPYQPPAEFLAAAKGRPYLGEVAAMDHAIGKLLSGLRSEGAFDDLAIFVVGDHGEAHGRHGEPTHSVFCYDTTMHVPFIARLPQNELAGTREPGVVTVADLHPTVLGALGLEALGPIDGRDLFAGGSSSSSRGVYVESYSGYISFGWSPIVGWVDSGGKYLHSSDPELFDWQTDPGELENLVEARGADVEVYRERIAWVAELPRLATDRLGLDTELLEGIQALGYMGAGEVDDDLPHPLEVEDLPAARHRTRELNDFHDATTLVRDGRVPEAIELMRALVAAHPTNLLAQENLGRLLQLEGRDDEAVEVFENLMNQPGHASSRHYTNARHSLGHAFEGRGDFERALELFKGLREQHPTDDHFDDDVKRVEGRMESGGG